MYSKRNKYKAKKTEVDGITFHSKREASRYRELLLLEKSGIITNLELQKKYTFQVGDEKICSYLADFVYKENDKEIVEDVKGFDTPLSKLKRQMMKAFFNIDVVIIK